MDKAKLFERTVRKVHCPQLDMDFYVRSMTPAETKNFDGGDDSLREVLVKCLVDENGQPWLTQEDVDQIPFDKLRIMIKVVRDGYGDPDEGFPNLT